MGEVWRARDSRLNRLVAVKMLPREVAGDSARRARFEQEARALAALNHPNIVTIYDVGEDGGRAYIVSELVEGEPLRSVLDRAVELMVVDRAGKQTSLGAVGAVSSARPRGGGRVPGPRSAPMIEFNFLQYE